MSRVLKLLVAGGKCGNVLKPENDVLLIGHFNKAKN